MTRPAKNQRESVGTSRRFWITTVTAWIALAVSIVAVMNTSDTVVNIPAETSPLVVLDQPIRALDTRMSLNGERVNASAPISLDIAELLERSADEISSVVLNVTAVGPSAPSFLVVYPADEVQPRTANFAFLAGQTTSNVVFVALSELSGKVLVAVGNGSSDVVVDVLGYSSNR